MIAARLSEKNVILCGDAVAKTRKGTSLKTPVRLVHESNNHLKQPNVMIRLPKFVESLGHLEDRLLDLLEIAAYVFAGDRRVSRGGNRAVMFNAWSRTMHFVFRVRDHRFWAREDVQAALSDALVFLTGDKSFTFDFQKGRQTFPAGIFDQRGLSLPPDRPTKVVLFSGGLDSLAGALELLNESESHLCFVSHRSGQTGTQRTQERLINALHSQYQGRITPFRFECHLVADPAVDESQRSRSFLYTAIAFAVAASHGLDEISIFENGVTSMNLTDQSDMVNARMSRTTHPKSIDLLGHLFSLIAERSFKIKTPFFWRTKTDVAKIIKKYGASSLVTSSISCGRTRERRENSTHCGACSQCIDRRLALWAAHLEADDESKLYATDFIHDSGASDLLLESTLTDFIRLARNISLMSANDFGLQRLDELSEVIPFVGDSSERDRIIMLHDLYKRHADDLATALRRISSKFDDPMKPPPEGVLLRMIRERKYFTDASGKSLLDENTRDAASLLRELKQIQCGHDDAYKYEKCVEKLLSAIFRDFLSNPKSQVSQDGKLRRIDITFTNEANDGFFSDLAVKSRLLCQFILFECKNYADDPAQKEFSQLRNNLGDNGKPQVGFLVCRNWGDRSKALEFCKSKFPNVLMMPLDDNDLKMMLTYRSEGKTSEVWRRLADEARVIMMK